MAEASQKDLIVDVFYYDFILTTCIDAYKKGTSINDASTHLQIATHLCRRIRNKNVLLDEQLYVKELYLKVLQMMKFYEDKFINKKCDDLSMFLKGFECLRVITNEFPEIKENQQFQKLGTVCVAIYKTAGMDKKEASTEDGKMFSCMNIMYNEKMSKNPKELEELIKGFSMAKVGEYLKDLHFDNPVMKKFADYIKEGLDQKENRK
jgi:hypothetical protein